MITVLDNSGNVSLWGDLAYYSKHRKCSAVLHNLQALCNTATGARYARLSHMIAQILRRKYQLVTIKRSKARLRV